MAHPDRVLPGGVPMLTAGDGPPVVVLPGLQSEHGVPTGMDRRMQLAMLRPLRERFTVHLLGPPPGLEPGVTMADVAASVGGAIRAAVDPPVRLFATSTGASLALQLAVDEPPVVDRLVVAPGAARLSAAGREAQRRLADLTEQGRPRAAWAGIAPLMATGRLSARLLTTAMWLLGPVLDPSDAADMIAMIRAEDAFDVSDRLHRITAATLVVGGGRDGFYSPELLRATARGIDQGWLLLLPRRGHLVLGHRVARDAIVRFLSGERPRA